MSLRKQKKNFSIDNKKLNSISWIKIDIYTVYTIYNIYSIICIYFDCLLAYLVIDN